MHVLAIRDAERRNLVQGKGSYSDRKRALKWVLLVTVPQTVLDATASLRTASVRQDQRQYCVLVLRTHPVGAVVLIRRQEMQTDIISHPAPVRWGVLSLANIGFRRVIPAILNSPEA